MILSRIEALKNGIKAYSEAFSFIRMHKLGYFFLFPLAFSVILIVSGWQGTSWLTDTVLDYVNKLMNFEQWHFWGAAALVFILKSVIWIAFRLLFFLTITYLGGYIIIILMSPVYAYLSEKTATLITKTETPFDLFQFLSDIIRGILLALRNFLLETLFTIVLLIFSFVPVVGLLSAPVMIFITAYFYGFAFIDYSLERKR